MIITPYERWLIDSYTLREVNDWYIFLTRGDRLIPTQEVIDWFLHLMRCDWLITTPYESWLIASYTLLRGDWLITIQLTRDDWLIPIHLTRGEWLIPGCTPYKRWLIDSYTPYERWLIYFYTLREVVDWYLYLMRGDWLIPTFYKRWLIDSYTWRELIDSYNYYRHLIDSYTPFERLLIDSYTLREVIDWFLYLKRGDWLIPIPNERWLIDSYTPARGVWSNLQVYLDDTYSEKSVYIIHTLSLKICNHNYFSYHLVPGVWVFLSKIFCKSMCDLFFTWPRDAHEHLYIILYSFCAGADHPEGDYQGRGAVWLKKSRHHPLQPGAGGGPRQAGTQCDPD